MSFQMQSFHRGEGWTAMEKGAAPRRWRPMARAVDAAAQCLAWTGFVGIPAMQVVDLDTGTVVWRFGDTYPDGSLRYPDAGPQVELPEPDQAVAETLARQILSPDTPACRPARAPDPDTSPDTGAQMGLWTA